MVENHQRIVEWLLTEIVPLALGAASEACSDCGLPPEADALGNCARSLRRGEGDLRTCREIVQKAHRAVGDLAEQGKTGEAIERAHVALERSRSACVKAGHAQQESEYPDLFAGHVFAAWSSAFGHAAHLDPSAAQAAMRELFVRLAAPQKGAQ